MCGIIGVIGNNNAPFKAFSGLKKLEYRGYDSWGIAFKSCNGIEIEKKTGKIPKDEKGLFNHNSYCSIAHTRWATHGKVTQENAHPVSSQSKALCVVHNGIVENFEELKKMLEEKGFSFRTQTDTEVIANLVELELSKNPKDIKEALRRALLQVRGNYAVVLMHKDFFEIFCAKNSSPLVLGIADKDLFVASDVTAFLPYTKKAVYLEDNEMAVLGKDWKVFDTVTGKIVSKKIDEVTWSVEQAKKGNFEHFMLKEIFEQPQSIKNAAAQPQPELERATQMVKQAKGVFFVGCGSSFHACLCASYFFSDITKMHVNPVLASEFSNYSSFLTKDTLVVAVSQSGETADVLDAVKTAKKAGSKILSIVNVMGSSLVRLSDETLLMNAGPEICVLSTKTYTSQLSLLLLLAFSVAGKKEEGKKLLEKTALLCEKALESSKEKARELAKKIVDKTSIFVIGRHVGFPTALECALKIKEVSYIHAEGFAGGELKHGTISLIEEGVPVIVLGSQSGYEMIQSNAQEVKTRGAWLIGIATGKNQLFDEQFELEDAGPASPILMVLPVQLLAYFLAVEKKLDPDMPRNLAKSVTVK